MILIMLPAALTPALPLSTPPSIAPWMLASASHLCTNPGFIDHMTAQIYARASSNLALPPAPALAWFWCRALRMALLKLRLRRSNARSTGDLACRGCMRPAEPAPVQLACAPPIHGRLH